MTASSDLVARLNNPASEVENAMLCVEAAARILSLEADKAALVEALQAVELARHTDKTLDWTRATRLSDTALAKHGGVK